MGCFPSVWLSEGFDSDIAGRWPAGLLFLHIFRGVSSLYKYVHFLSHSGVPLSQGAVRTVQSVIITTQKSYIFVLRRICTFSFSMTPHKFCTFFLSHIVSHIFHDYVHFQNRFAHFWMALHMKMYIIFSEILIKKGNHQYSTHSSAHSPEKVTFFRTFFSLTALHQKKCNFFVGSVLHIFREMYISLKM